MARLNRDEISRFIEHNLDVSSRTIYFGYGDPDGDCDLDQVLAANTIKSLYLLDKVRPDTPITLLINNQGGDDQHGLAIYDAIKTVSSQVTGVVYGHCQSMAVWVLQACDVREISPHSVVMIHNGSGSLEGRTEEIDAWKKWQDKQDRICADILLSRIREKHPQFQRARLNRMLKTDTIMSPQEALDLGLVDRILE